MRIILYTGKGGVGKTSISAATAIKLSKEGKRVLVISTDQAHSLGDAFEKTLGSKPTEIMQNLHAMEIDVVEESEKAWGNFKGFFKALLTSRTEEGIEVEEMLVFPGLEELFALFKVLEIYKDNQYDVLIVDCAPTGETLALLKFPEMLGDLVSNVLPMKRKAVKVARPIMKTFTNIPMPEDAVFDDFEHLMVKLEALQTLMLDKTCVSIRIVTTPEKIVIEECKRNFTCLHLYDYNVDGIIINKVYPDEALIGYFNKWVTLQKEGLSDIEASFTGIPLFKLALQKHEIKGLSVLETIGSFYGAVDPSQVLSHEPIYKLFKNEKGHMMTVSLPFADKREMDLSVMRGAVHLSIKNEMRKLTLPDYLWDKSIASAKFEGGELKIQFDQG